MTLLQQIIIKKLKSLNAAIFTRIFNTVIRTFYKLELSNTDFIL